VPEAVGAATEGTETRFGVPQSATFAAATTLTSTGSVDSFHDSYTALGGMVPIMNMMLGEVAPGGTGSGLYGMLVLAVITVFVAGLMVGRTPEYVGKKIQSREIKFASLYFSRYPDPCARWNGSCHGFVISAGIDVEYRTPWAV
jgi:potassium-transporting ATPase potassium-binding subunit